MAGAGRPRYVPRVSLRLTALAVLLAVAVRPGSAIAQPEPAPVPTEPAPAPTEPASVEPAPAAPVEPATVEELPDPGADFGPVLTLEAIEITGNRTTQDDVIRRVLPVHVGDVLRAGDPRLVGARYKVLALGYFRDVQASLRRGGARGRVVLVITVEERGTVVLNRLWFGASDSSVFWLGTDLDERNLFGTGLSVGAGGIYARAGEIRGGRDQWAAEFRLADPTLGNSRWGLGGALTVIRGSEPYRVAGEATDSAPRNFLAFDYRRLGGRATATYALTPLARVTAGARVELIDADLPSAPTRMLGDGRAVAIDLGLRPGGSRVVSGFVGFDRDNRPDPVLPHEGTRFALSAEIGSSLIGSNYDFTVFLARWEHWWPLAQGRHAFGLRAGGGVVLGDAPRFDRIHVSDVNRLITPRALGLVVATSAAPDFLGTDNEDVLYGDVGGSFIAEYAVRLFRRRFHVYGGDLFVGGGVWALASTDDLHARDRGVWDSLPIDLVIDAGLRIDTEIGVFELTIANALGRAPL